MTIRFKARHADANDVVQPDGWWIEGESGELAPGTKRGPYERRLDARKALDAGRRPYAVLIARADALATDLGKTPPAPRCASGGHTCIRMGTPEAQLCAACAAYRHVLLAVDCLRRVQAVEEQIAAENAREQQACEVAADEAADRLGE